MGRVKYREWLRRVADEREEGLAGARSFNAHKDRVARV